jgi:hypothetical protein
MAKQREEARLKAEAAEAEALKAKAAGSDEEPEYE